MKTKEEIEKMRKESEKKPFVFDEINKDEFKFITEK